MINALGILVRASEREIVGEQKDSGQEAEDITTGGLQSELYHESSPAVSMYELLCRCSILALRKSLAPTMHSDSALSSSPTLATVQAQIMISIFLLNSKRASDAWLVLGSLSESS